MMDKKSPVRPMMGLSILYLSSKTDVPDHLAMTMQNRVDKYLSLNMDFM